MISFKLRLIREKNRVYSLALLFLSKLKKGPEIYVFHDIVDKKTDIKSKFCLTQNSFETFLLKQIQFGCLPLTTDELTNMIGREEPYNKKSFCVTFDDCNTSVYTKAFPFLKKNNIPFILFLTKDLIGKDNYLTTDQIIEMSGASICTIGSHALSHKMFRTMTDEEAKAELIDSRVYLKELTGQSVDSFAFPYGRLVEVSCRNIKLLRDSVYKFAFSAIDGNLSLQWFTGKYYLPRITVSEEFVQKTLSRYNF